jgi:hypothetical protein
MPEAKGLYRASRSDAEVVPPPTGHLRHVALEERPQNQALLAAERLLNRRGKVPAIVQRAGGGESQSAQSSSSAAANPPARPAQIPAEEARESLTRLRNIWRRYVDLRHQHWGEEVYDVGYHGGQPEPGFRESMINGEMLAREHVGQRLDADFYFALQEQTYGHRAAPERGLRHGDSDFMVRVPEAYMDPARVFDATQDASLGQQEISDRIATLEAEAHDKLDVGIRITRSDQVYEFTFSHPVRDEADAREQINRIFADFYSAMEVALPARQTERIRTEIARAHKRLEYLHVFTDGNTRRNLVVLNRLMADSGFEPVILTNPNAVYIQTLQQWVESIREGEDREEDEVEREQNREFSEARLGENELSDQEDGWYDDHSALPYDDQ